TLDALGGHVVRHVEQHLVGRIGRRDHRGGLDAGFARRNHDGVEAKSHDFPRRSPVVHAAPAFIKSCRCTIPTTRRPPSSTGSAMIPCCSITCTAAPANTSGVVVLGVRVITSPTGIPRN